MEALDSNVIALLPAYGRQFAIGDWINGKDFRILDGPCCSIRDAGKLREAGYTHIWFLDRDTTFVMEVPLTVQ